MTLRLPAFDPRSGEGDRDARLRRPSNPPIEGAALGARPFARSGRKGRYPARSCSGAFVGAQQLRVCPAGHVFQQKPPCQCARCCGTASGEPPAFFASAQLRQADATRFPFAHGCDWGVPQQVEGVASCLASLLRSVGHSTLAKRLSPLSPAFLFTPHVACPSPCTSNFSALHGD